MPSLWHTFGAGLLLAGTCATAWAELPADCHSSEKAPAAPHICKVDPPNWWPAMHAPMLLLYGQGLDTAQFRLSDPALRTASASRAISGLTLT